MSSEDIMTIFALTKKLKKELREKKQNKTVLAQKTLAMVFEKPSLRTRVSFETGMTQLGGHAINLDPSSIKMGERETPSDVAKNLSRMVDIIMARVFKHSVFEELALNSEVPIINGLSDLEHPCQALADLFTIFEYKKSVKKIAYVGDCENNVTHSLASLCSLLRIPFFCAGPKKYWMNEAFVGKYVIQLDDPREAVQDADVIITDTWVSMGDEREKEERLKVFKRFQVNEDLVKYAKKDYLFLHCLPAYRGYEVTKEIIDGKHSVVYDEAENRLHVQKALILYLLSIDY